MRSALITEEEEEEEEEMYQLLQLFGCGVGKGVWIKKRKGGRGEQGDRYCRARLGKPRTSYKLIALIH